MFRNYVLKISMALLLLPMTLGVACASTTNVDGGSWSHGISNGVVYSKFIHQSKRHYSSVINYKGQYERGNANAGYQSKADLPSGPGTDCAYYGFY